jgi:mono/diheme cytochrome c family protein
MGLAEGPDGSLYISESNKGKIWRVMFKGDKDNFGEKDLAAMEKRKSRSYIKDPDEVKDRIYAGAQNEGWKLYNVYCTNCHQRNGKGDNNRFPPLAGSEWVTGNKDTLIGILLNGLKGEITVKGKKYNGLMPPFGHLNDHAIASLATYIRTRFRNDADGVSALEVKKVRDSRK